MEDRSDIWRQLKDHEAKPPPQLKEGLLLILDTFADHQAADNESMENRAMFQRLKDHPIPPPATVSTAISSAIKPSPQPGETADKTRHTERIRTRAERIKSRAARVGTPHTERIRTRRFLTYISAAACFLLIVGGAILYHPSATAKKLSFVAPKQVAKRDTTTLSPAPAAIPAIKTIPTRPRQLALALDDNSLPLTDNNILATFTEYKYPSLAGYVTKEKEETGMRIHLDQYTDISLSPAMTATLKMLYDKRPDGTLDRRARKTKEKLEKWEAEDKKQFDPHYSANPLDPIDLAEFIFPPLISFWRSGPAALPAAESNGAAASAHGAAPGSTAASTNAPAPNTASATSNNPITVSYSLSLVTKRSTAGIAETYNGGMQTLFDDGDNARLRLASLMRIESIFLTPDRQTVTMLAESAKPQLKTVLTAGQWQKYNAKYADAAYDLTTDTTTILGYSCKKAVVSLHDGRLITAWYTPRIQEPAQTVLEPAFARIPGLVLRYEYTCRHRTVSYTATAVNRRPIDPSVFNITSTP